MRLATAFATTSTIALSMVMATTSFAQGGAPAGGGRPRMVNSSGADSATRSFLLSLPVASLGGETLGHMEFNLGGQGSLGIEGGVQRKYEHIAPKEQLASGESLVTSAVSAAIIVSRYTDGMAMGGFYWTLGLGYRDVKGKWSVSPANDDKQVNTALVDEKTERLNHDLTMKGTTGIARFGYRYVGTDFPLVIGLYLGAQHFQATVRDVEHRSADASTEVSAEGDAPNYAPMTDLEKLRLKRTFMTTPQAALELGFVF